MMIFKSYLIGCKVYYLTVIGQKNFMKLTFLLDKHYMPMVYILL